MSFESFKFQFSLIKLLAQFVTLVSCLFHFNIFGFVQIKNYRLKQWRHSLDRYLADPFLGIIKFDDKKLFLSNENLPTFLGISCHSYNFYESKINRERTPMKRKIILLNRVYLLESQYIIIKINKLFYQNTFTWVLLHWY